MPRRRREKREKAKQEGEQKEMWGNGKCRGEQNVGLQCGMRRVLNILALAEAWSLRRDKVPLGAPRGPKYSSERLRVPEL